MFNMCAVCTWTIKSQALPKGDLQLTQCNHLGLGGLFELLEAEFEDKEDEVVVVVLLEAIEAVEATDPDVKLWLVEAFDDWVLGTVAELLHSKHEGSVSSLRLSHLQVNLNLQ